MIPYDATENLINNAGELTERQVIKARELYVKLFRDTSNPEVLAAMIQAMAINYQTETRPG